ncbi:hypothetical protein BCR42DRAFT_444081 [Absidia repens]|uniref:Uncharacterized protein n=1 Tax=Absidia repens TaxID=90262 RepID=A0A1X2HY06_9FUNG|nr:hypothetical protein BCR42DRAFT_444081 [Absidia repens]
MIRYRGTNNNHDHEGGNCSVSSRTSGITVAPPFARVTASILSGMADVEGSIYSTMEDDYVNEQHAYKVNTLRQSTPFTIPVEINQDELKAVVDTNASVSVISSTLGIY